MGRCPACGEWNTMVEEPKKEKKSSSATGRSRAFVATESDARPLTLGEISLTAENRFSIGLAEVDRLLGGGMVEGSMILLGGEPGIGKSTLALQIPLNCASLKTLYVSGE